MPRKPVGKRGDTWALKTKPELHHPYLASRHSSMAQSVKEAFNSLDQLLIHVYSKLDAEGVSANDRIIYRAFVEELWRIRKRMGKKAFEKEAQAIITKYALYGANLNILIQLASFFGLTFLIPPIGHKLITWGLGGYI